MSVRGRRARHAPGQDHGASQPKPLRLGSVQREPAARVDLVTADGSVLGWAFDPRAGAPPTVRVLHRGTMVAEARACVFRIDLLRAGFGHGHCAFGARLRHPLPPGPASLAVQFGDGEVMPAGRIDVPAQTAAPPCTVEALLAPPATWTAADLLGNIGCLPWAAYFAHLGADRFIDAAFRFVLERWPSPAETAVHARSLARGEATPEGLIGKLLRSRERADRPPALMSPYDPAFLFQPGLFNASSATPGLLPSSC